ncbi:MAG TPA: S9 family peptidase, partial [Blastocatellia bacterium]|nr:S9 family peptidase [Blastocatellia bacterium]
MNKNRVFLLAALCCAIALLGIGVGAQKSQYPQTRKVDHVDTYHGTTVPDPYRWLEDDNSAETAKWVEEQNEVTFAYLDKIPYRAKLKE